MIYMNHSIFLILDTCLLGNDWQLTFDFRLLAFAEAEVAALAALGQGLGTLQSPAEHVATHDVGLADKRSELTRSDILG